MYASFKPPKLLRNEDIDMNGHSIKGVRHPVDRSDAATKIYVDCIQYKTATGIISGATHTTICSSHFPAETLLQTDK